MYKKFLTIFSAMFALLALTSTASHATVIETVDTVFSNGGVMTGTITFTPEISTGPQGAFSEYQMTDAQLSYSPNQYSPFTPLSFGGNAGPVNYVGGNFIYLSGAGFSAPVPVPYPLGLGFFDGLIDGLAPPNGPYPTPNPKDIVLTSGFYLGYTTPPFDVPNVTEFAHQIGGGGNCISGCTISAVPIPASLPLFGTALLGLVGFAAVRKFRQSKLG